MIKNMKLVLEPYTGIEIKLPTRTFNKCQEFAKEVYSTNKECYSRRGQSDETLIKRQIITGKLGEWATYHWITSRLGMHCNEPDMEIYTEKSFDSDLKCGHIDGDIFNIHVKSILHHNVKDYGISFLMEKKDKLFKDNLKMGEVFAFNVVKDKNTVYFKGFLNAAMAVLGEPKKTSLESKYAIYFEDQNKDAVLFHLSI